MEIKRWVAQRDAARPNCCRRTWEGASVPHSPPPLLRVLPVPQELNVAIIKATTSQFHVVPKEKHVRSE